MSKTYLALPILNTIIVYFYIQEDYKEIVGGTICALQTLEFDKEKSRKIIGRAPNQLIQMAEHDKGIDRMCIDGGSDAEIEEFGSVDLTI